MGNYCRKASYANFFNSTNTSKQVILIIGGHGTGKSIVSARLSEEYQMHLITKQDYEVTELDNIFNRPCHKIKDIILQCKEADIILEDFPIDMDQFNDWKNVIAQHCSVKGCIYLYCSNETMKYRLYQKVPPNQSFGDIDNIVDEYLNKILSNLDIILECVQTIKVCTTEKSIDQVLFEIKKELEKQSWKLDSKSIQIKEGYE